MAETGKTRKQFQSTLPTRGSDVYAYMSHFALGISIHAPHEGERHARPFGGFLQPHISIHAPHEGERRAQNQLV